MAVDTSSQSAVKAAGDDARGRHRGTGTPGGKVRRSLSTHWYAWAMVAPVVIVIGVIIGYPLVRGIYLSLTDANERNVARSIGVNEIPATYEFVGLDNYVEALTGGSSSAPSAGRWCGRCVVSPSPSASASASPTSSTAGSPAVPSTG